MPHRLFRFWSKRAEQGVGTLRQCPRHSAARPVGADRDRSVDSCVEEFRQRVLHERQGAWAIDDLADHLCHHEGVDGDPGFGGRTGDGGFELLDRHRRDHFGAVAQQFAETAMAQRAVVEVGAQRDDNSGPAARRRDRARRARR